MRISNDSLLISNSGDMAQATLTSEVVRVESAYLIALQAVATGAPVGSLKLQASLDPINPTNWSDVGTPVAVSAAGTFLLRDTDVSYLWVRLVYTKTSGSGTLAARLNAKGV